MFSGTRRGRAVVQSSEAPEATVVPSGATRGKAPPRAPGGRPERPREADKSLSQISLRRTEAEREGEPRAARSGELPEAAGTCGAGRRRGEVSALQAAGRIQEGLYGRGDPPQNGQTHSRIQERMLRPRFRETGPRPEYTSFMSAILSERTERVRGEMSSAETSPKSVRMLSSSLIMRVFLASMMRLPLVSTSATRAVMRKRIFSRRSVVPRPSSLFSVLRSSEGRLAGSAARRVKSSASK